NKSDCRRVQVLAYFNEHFSRPLFYVLPVQSAADDSQPAFLPLLVNSALFLCVPDLSLHAHMSAIDPVGADEPYIRRHQFEQFVRTFGGQLSSAIQLAHYSFFASNGQLYSWFHGHDHSFDAYSYKGRDAFLIRFSHTAPGALTVLSCRAGVWEKRHLTCTSEGWQAVSESGDKRSVLGEYRSINAYIHAHHRNQQPIVTPFAAMFPAALSPSEAGRAWSADESSEQTVQVAALGSNCKHAAILAAHAADSVASSNFTTSDPAIPAPYPTIATYSIIPVASASSPHSSLPSTPQSNPDSPYSSTVVDSNSSAQSEGDVALMSDSDDSQTQQQPPPQRSQPPVRSGTGCESIAMHEFFYAIAMDDVEAVLSVIRQKRVKLTATDDYGLTCLHIACAHNRSRILHILRRHVPVSLLAAVTLKPLRLANPVLSMYSAANQWMPYMKTDLDLPLGSPCGSVACAYQSSGCLAFIQQWLGELGVQYKHIAHQSHEQLAQKA
ncbi:hypothetical protein MMC34_008779, partial [Xylographa carneopallida]|nr:hypothetical protein [Xylographa carneopallida]